jgi:hypothetical protein
MCKKKLISDSPNQKLNFCFNTYGRFSNLLAISSVNDCAHESFDSADLADDCFVALIVARQVGKDTSSTGDDIDIAGTQQLYQGLKKTFQTLLLLWDVKRYKRSKKTSRRERHRVFCQVSFQANQITQCRLVCLQKKSKANSPKYQPTCFVAASDKLRQVHRQFWTKRWL